MRKDVRGALRATRYDEASGRLEGELVFDEGLSVFAGHFPGRPLLPAVLEVEAVRAAAERAIGGAWRITRVARAKFAGEVHPGEAIALEAAVTRDGDRLKVDAKLRGGEALKAAIVVEMEAPQAAGE